MTWQEIIKKYEERNNPLSEVHPDALQQLVGSVVSEAAGRVAKQQAEDFYGKPMTPDLIDKEMDKIWRVTNAKEKKE